MQTTHFIKICSDIGAGKRGTSQGVEQIWQRYQTEEPNATVSTFTLTADQTAYPEAKHIETLTPFFQQTLVPALSKQFKQRDFPLILSGDHANAIGTLTALSHANPDKRIGVLWIDAHCDLHTPYTSPSGNMHGMSLALGCLQDNQQNAVRQPHNDVVQHWETLKNLVGNGQGINPQDVCFLGLRSYEPEEKALLTHYAIPHYSAQQMREQGFEHVLNQVKAHFNAVDLLYVSFDVDALDSTLIPATGTPEPEGFTEKEVAQILTFALDLPQLCAFEMTEFNPTLAENCLDRIYTLWHNAIQQIIKSN